MVKRAHVATMVLLLAACAAGRTPAAGVGPAVTVVYLVRHAEKAGGDDPPLTAAGRARAADLARALAGAGITGAVVTQRRRTGETAEPVLRPLGIVADTVPLGGTVAEHAAAVAARIRARHLGGTVLVVGHSNTVPAIMTALGAPPMPDLCDAEHANLFVLRMGPGAVQVTRGRYGAADPPGASECRA